MSFYSCDAINLLYTCFAQFILSDTKGNARFDLLKLVDNCIKACFLGKHTHWRQCVLSWALFQDTQPPEGKEQRKIKLSQSQTECQLAHQCAEFVTSLVYVYIYP